MGAVDVSVLRTVLEVQGVGAYASAMVRAAASHGILDSAVDRSQQRLQMFGQISGAAAVAGAVGLGKFVQQAGKVEQFKVAFTTLEGSAEGASRRMAELAEFDKRSPFNFEQTVAGAQRLHAMGIRGKELIPTMTAIGDAVSAVGGDTEAFNGVVRAIGQVKTRGKMMQEELNQITERGIPAAEILKEELGLTAEQMGNLGSQGISAERAIAALMKGFTKRFGGSMEEQSKTLQGSLQTLQGSMFQLGAAVGAPLVGPITYAAKKLSDLATAATNLDPAVKGILGPVGVLAVGALGAFSLWMRISQTRATLLAGENAALMNSALKAARGTDTETTAIKGVGNISRTSTPLIDSLAKAHERAAFWANRHAQAEERLNRAMGRTGGAGISGRPTAGPPAVSKTTPGVRPMTAASAATIAAAAAAGRRVAGPPAAADQSRPTAGPPAVRPVNGVSLPAQTAAQVATETVKQPWYRQLWPFGRGAQPAAAADLADDAVGTAAKGGRLARLGGAAVSGLKGGAAGLALQVGGELALGGMQDEGPQGKWKRVGQRSLEGAMWGGLAGGMFGQPLAGAAVGAAGMGGWSAMHEFGPLGKEAQATKAAKGAEEKAKDPQAQTVALLQEQNRLLQAQLDQMQKPMAEVPYNTQSLAHAQQVGILAFARAVS